MKSVLLSVLGLILGAITNGILVQIGSSVIEAPLGLDLSTEKGLAKAMPLMEFKHFVFPFLAHALGTLISALIIARFAASRQLQWALNISALFFMGGVYMVTILPSPLWFNIIDLVFAYFPMAFLGYRLGKKALNR